MESFFGNCTISKKNYEEVFLIFTQKVSNYENMDRVRKNDANVQILLEKATNKNIC